MGKFEEHKNLIYSKLLDKTNDMDFVELSELVYGKQYSSRVCRGMMYGSKYTLMLLDEIGIESLEDDKLEEIEVKLQELKKERYKVSDQKRELNNTLRRISRFENLEEHIFEEIRNMTPIDFNYGEAYKPSNNEAALILSDWHYGKEFYHSTNVFDVTVLKNRVDELINKTIDYCKLMSVKVLYVEILGDMIEGLIHLTSKVQASEQAISQIMNVSEVLSNAIAKLAEYVPSVKVVNVLGNHARCNPNYKDSLNENNFERLIPWYLKPRLKHIKNISFLDNIYDDELGYFTVCNSVNICTVHGHRETKTNTISNLEKTFKIDIDELHMGHWHSSKSFTDFDQTIEVNGSLCGSDRYSVDKRFGNSALQKLIVYNKEGRIATFPIKL